METTRLSTKGPIVLPLSIRKSHACKAGTEFTVEETPQGILLRPAPVSRGISLAELDLALRRIRDQVARRIGNRARPVTLEEMDAGVVAAIAERHARGRP